MDVSARVTSTTTTTAMGGGGLSIVPPTKSPEAESETPPRIPPTKPNSFSNGILKRHAPPIVVYKECLKNHAASLGGHALDGCGEFMPSPTVTAEDPTSLKCAACGCHRNFHRREPEELTINATNASATTLTHVIEYHPHHRHHPLPPPSTYPQTAPPAAARGVRSPGSQSPPPISSSFYPGSAPHMLLALSGGVGAGVGVPDSTTPTTTNGPHQHHQHQQSNQGSRKRFRTKFSQEQKDRMYEFAEKVGWKMLKTNEDLVNKFCNEIGVERTVFKVWMHNNKNTFGKRSSTNTTTTTTITTTAAPCNHDATNIPTTTDVHHHHHGLNTNVVINHKSNHIDDDDNNVDDEEEDEDGNLNGDGNNSNSSSINNSHRIHHHHHNSNNNNNNHHHHLQQQEQYNGGGKSNESNAPTNGSSCSS